MKDKELEEQFLVWVMANRDTPARKWADEIEPELKRQLSDLITQERRKAYKQGGEHALTEMKLEAEHLLLQLKEDKE